MLSRVTILSFALASMCACSRQSSHTYKAYEYVRDLPAGYIVSGADFSAVTYELDGTEAIMLQRERAATTARARDTSGPAVGCTLR